MRNLKKILYLAILVGILAVVIWAVVIMVQSWRHERGLLGGFSTRGFSTLESGTPCTPYTITDSASTSIDWNNSCVQVLNRDYNLTFSTWSNGFNQGRLFLVVTASGSSPGTITWPSSVKWASTSQTAPTLAGAGKVDIFEFIAVTSGSYYGRYDYPTKSAPQ